MNFSGHWEGFYVQNPSAKRRTLADAPEDEQFPIEAWIEQNDSAITGKMHDHRTRRVSMLTEVIKAFSFFARERWLPLLRHYPDATVTTTLPADSSLVGKVNGSRIAFRKEYSGPGKYLYNIGDRSSEVELAGVIYYYGVASETGDCIEGYYCLSRNPFNREAWRRQPFRLVRREQ